MQQHSASAANAADTAAAALLLALKQTIKTKGFQYIDVEAFPTRGYFRERQEFFKRRMNMRTRAYALRVTRIP